MSQITVDAERCRRDRACVAVCPSGALRSGGDGFPEETPGGNCILCGHSLLYARLAPLLTPGCRMRRFFPCLVTCRRRGARRLADQPAVGSRIQGPADRRETLEALLDVARRAPTAVNSQKLHWIVAGDAAKGRALSAEAMNWVRASRPNWKALLEPWSGGTTRSCTARPDRCSLRARRLPLGRSRLCHRPDVSGAGGRSPRPGRMLGGHPDPCSPRTPSFVPGAIRPRRLRRTRRSDARRAQVHLPAGPPPAAAQRAVALALSLR